MKLHEALKSWCDQEGPGQGPHYRRQLEDLIGHELGLSWSDIQLNQNRYLSQNERHRLDAKVHRLLGGEPLAYIIEMAHFFRSSFKVDRSVLIPRPETEILVEKALTLAGSEALILDLGAGSGCIGLSLARERPDSQVILLEKCPKAFVVIEQNRQALGISNVDIRQAVVGEESLLTPGTITPFDLIVANPPYIAKGDSRVSLSTRRYEPHLALYCEDQGLECIKNWLLWSWPRLKPEGSLIFEFGQGQETSIADFIKNTDYSIIEVIEDYSKIKRFYVLKK